ncbi:hypothetical protein [Nonomuraea sp. NPDC050310]|uniref:hypothetical protein n=1 Tax=Nonomuraea sp. NPDC050310 TaxID=3154935 RepID=UPI0033EEC33C
MRYVAIWLGATVVAISVSWFAVRGVLRSEFVADVVVRPMAAHTETARNTAALPSPAAVTTPAPRPVTQPPTPTPRRTKSGKDLKVLTVKGGEVVFRLDRNGCALVSATPKSGYTTRVSRNDGWIRVDLAQGAHGSAAFCIGSERRTDTWEY